LGGEEDTVNAFGANGLLGVGPFAQDCGDDCVNGFQAGAGSAYYACSSAGTCTGTAVALNQQVINPVANFSKDNNGVILELPSISSTGAAGVNGSLVFGIGTQSNNMLASSVKVLTGDTSFGNSSSGDISTTYHGTVYPESYLDSGSTLFFFNDSTIQQCATQQGLYCPSSTLNLSATNEGANHVTSTVSFNIGNGLTLLSENVAYTAFNDLGGTVSGTQSFDFGLPFFYGRNVAVAIFGASTPEAVGPYFAY
jgi:hypothetical protein